MMGAAAGWGRAAGGRGAGERHDSRGERPPNRRAARSVAVLGLRPRHARADEDREHDRRAGEALRAVAAQREGDAQGDRGGRVAAWWTRPAGNAALPDSRWTTACAPAATTRPRPPRG